MAFRSSLCRAKNKQRYKENKGLGVGGKERGKGEIRRGESHADSTQQWIERSKHASLGHDTDEKEIEVKKEQS